jgi:hypothetical protein
MAKENADIEWSVFVLRQKAQFIGRVIAPDATSAIKTALKELPIPEHLRSKLSVQRA